jgi:hypothetical protein
MLATTQDEEDWVQFHIQDIEKIKKVYYGEIDTWNFVVSNLKCTPDNTGKAWFFFKIYLVTDKTKRLLWNEYNDTDYHTWSLGIGETTTRSFTFPPWTEAKHHQVKIELYWQGRLKPVAKRTVPVHVVKVFVHRWTPSPQIVLRKANKPFNLSISFKNGGNDDMYNISIAIVDADNLEITPQLQNLGIAGAGETKTVVFYVNASQTEEQRKIFNPRFEITYYDFRGEAHKEEYTATITVTANPLIHNLIRTLGAIAITTAIGTTALFVALVKRRKDPALLPKPSTTKGLVLHRFQSKPQQKSRKIRVTISLSNFGSTNPSLPYLLNSKPL